LFLLKKSETKTEESSSTPSDQTNVESISPPPPEPILEPISNVPPPVNTPNIEIRPTSNISTPRQNQSDNHLLSMFIFLFCMILSFLLLRRLFLTFGTNRSYPPPSTDPFHEDF
jgi:hypothetical protein